MKQTENLVKLCMQKLVTSFKALEVEDPDQQSQRKLSNTADNSVNNPEVAPAAGTPINNEETSDSRKETSIDEIQIFAETLRSVLEDPMTVKLLAKTRQIFALKGIETLSEDTRA